MSVSNDQVSPRSNRGVKEHRYSPCSKKASARKKVLQSIIFTLLTSGFGSASLVAQTPAAGPTKSPWPINFDLNVGGMVPSGEAGQAYSSSFLIGGGVNAPLNRWMTWDAITIDAGFGTAGGSRIIVLTDRSTRSTANYSAQIMSGARFMIPIKRQSTGRIEVGFGWAGIEHREYGVGKTSFVGNTTIREQISCNTCFSTFGNGYYGLVQLGVRGKYSRGGGVFLKWVEALDNGKGFSPSLFFPKQQRWITFGASFTFGFGG